MLILFTHFYEAVFIEDAKSVSHFALKERVAKW